MGKLTKAYIPMSISLDAETRDKLVRHAAALGISQTALIRQAIGEALCRLDRIYEIECVHPVISEDRLNGRKYCGICGVCFSEEE